MTHIYKFGYIINDEIKKIVVFFGSQQKSLDDLFVDDPENTIFDGVFSPDEKHTINEKSIKLDL